MTSANPYDLGSCHVEVIADVRGNANSGTYKDRRLANSEGGRKNEEAFLEEVREACWLAAVRV